MYSRTESGSRRHRPASGEGEEQTTDVMIFMSDQTQRAVIAERGKPWSDGERAQIAMLAERLKDPTVAYHTSVGYAGYYTFEKHSRYEHASDIRTLRAWETFKGGVNSEAYKEIIRRVAARIEAFKLAGLQPNGWARDKTANEVI